MPAGYLDATSYGADATGAQDSTSALASAINAGSSQGKGVWIPSGTFT
jgi:polygalacturonase